MISFYDGQLTDILPGNIGGKPEVQALSYALQQATQLLYKYSQRLYLYSAIDEQPDEVLDLMALELRTQYYRESLDIDTKRRLVKNTLIWYMTAGTPAAVEELVAAVFGEGEVKEWFEYGGNPYKFKILTNAMLTPEMDEFFSTMIRRVKNTRSYLEAIEIHRTVDQPLFAGVGQYPQYKPAAIIDGYDVDRTAEQTIFTNAGAVTAYKPAAVIDGFNEEGQAILNRVYSGAAAANQTKQAAIIDGFTTSAQDVQSEPAYAGTAQARQTKPAAIIDGFETEGDPVEQTTIYAGTALNSKYKETITE